MTRKISWRMIAFMAVLLALATGVPVQAQRFGGGHIGGGLGGGLGGGGFHPGMGAANFGAGSVVHRDFSPPAGLSRPSIPQNFQRPSLPSMPQHLNLPNRIGGDGGIHKPDFSGGIRPGEGGAGTHRPNLPDGIRPGEGGAGTHRPNLPDGIRPGEGGAGTHRPNLPDGIRPGQGGSGERHIPSRPDGEPDWKSWKDFNPKQIHNTVINKFQPNQTTIDNVRKNFNNHAIGGDIWSTNWFANHPDAWRPGHGPHPPGPGPHPGPGPGPHPPGPMPPPPPPGYWWGHPGWNNAWGWFGAGFFAGAVTDAVLAPIPYDYGGNIVYEGDTVYVNNVPYVGADEYYQQAQDLANSGSDEAVQSATTDAQPAASDTAATSQKVEDQWMAMGTFAVVADGKQTDSKRILQIATNKQGQVRGNLVDTETDKAIELYGAVDPKTQRVAFKLKGNDDVVAECGLWNLTQETVSMLVHVNRDKTEERTLIRLKDKDAGQSDPPATPAVAP